MSINEAENRGFSHPLEADLIRITRSDSPLDELNKIAKSRPYHTLTLEEQERLLAEVRMGRSDAEASLIRHSLPSINTAVRKFRGMGIPDDELLGLSLDSVRKTIKVFSQKEYDSDHYLKQSVINGNIDALTVAIAAHYRVLKADFDLISGYFKARKSFRNEIGRTPDADELNILVSMIAEDNPNLLPKKESVGPNKPYFKKLKSLNRIHDIFMAGNRDSGGYETQPDNSDPEKTLQFKSMTRNVRDALKSLSPKQAAVLDKRYGLKGEDPRTREEIAVLMGIDMDQVRQIEDQAMARLRHPAIRRRLRDYLDL